MAVPVDSVDVRLKTPGSKLAGHNIRKCVKSPGSWAMLHRTGCRAGVYVNFIPISSQSTMYPNIFTQPRLIYPKTVQVTRMKLDDIDKQIIAILEQDADASSTAIAETLGIAPETVKERLDRLADTRTKILVVDDEPDTLIPLTRALEADNYAVIGAADGAEALEKVTAETPDLILLDLMLPKVNGYEVCMKLKEDPLTRHIPIIMLSAKGEIKDKVLGIEIGAEDYVTKPFDLLELKTRIRALLRRSAM